jgi:acyl-coenzyme A thioesterase 9
MLASLTPVRDIRLSGHVIHVGRSSMEIVVKMEALEAGKPDQTLMLGACYELFPLVCRSSTEGWNGRALDVQVGSRWSVGVR